MKTKREKCQKCQKEFLIVEQELRFYEKKMLAEPKECSECRRTWRANLRNERNLYRRKCEKCAVELMSSYKEGGILCEQCYQTAVN